MKQSNKSDNSKANLDTENNTTARKPQSKKTNIMYNFNIKRYLPVVIVGIIIIASVFLCYKYINAFKQMTLLEKKNTCLQQQITAINTSLDKIDNTNKTIKTSYELQQEKNRIFSDLLSRLKNDISSIQNTDRTKWLVFEAEILVNLANQYLHTLKDKKQCLDIMQHADNLLQRSNQNLTFYIREKLNNSIAKLQTMNYINSDDIYLKLNFIEIIIEEASASDLINYNKAKTTETVKANVVTNNESTVYQFVIEKLNLLWNNLKQLFIITQRNLDDIYPLPQDQEINTIKLIIISNIEQAKISLLTRQQQIFNNSIKNISEKLKYLPSKHNNKLIHELELLAKIDFSIPAEDILSETLYALSQFNIEFNGADKKSNNTQDESTNSKDNN
jgi:uncharacterized protein HemX